MLNSSRTYTKAGCKAWTAQTLIEEVGKLALTLRAGTMQKAVQMCLERRPAHIVETGCIRGLEADGQSTMIWAMTALHIGATLHTYDCNHEHVETAKKWLGDLADDVVWNVSDSILGLYQIDYPVGFAYLDSFDWVEDDPQPSQRHMLAEVLLLQKHTTENAVVLLDDVLDGKGKTPMASKMLEWWGWKKVAEGYQELWSKI